MHFVFGECKVHPSICLVLHHPFWKFLQMEYQQSLSNCETNNYNFFCHNPTIASSILLLPSLFLPTKLAPSHLPLLPLTAASAVLLIRDTSICCILINRFVLSLIIKTISKKEEAFLWWRKPCLWTTAYLASPWRPKLQWLELNQPEIFTPIISFDMMHCVQVTSFICIMFEFSFLFCVQINLLNFKCL